MKPYYKIEETVESYLNGNISDTKKSVKKMSKLDFLNFILSLAQIEGAGCDDKFQDVFVRVRNLIN